LRANQSDTPFEGRVLAAPQRPERTRPRRGRAAKTRAKILEAALLVFSQNGYAKSLVSDIATAAQVSSALVIRHFQTKTLLFDNALSTSLASVSARSLVAIGQGKTALALLKGEDPRTLTAFSMLAHAIADPATRVSASILLERRLTTTLADMFPEVEVEPIARATAMVAIGYAVTRLLYADDRELNEARPFDRALGAVLELIAMTSKRSPL
jgi:AcrR family transcriptional regulator